MTPTIVQRPGRVHIDTDQHMVRITTIDEFGLVNHVWLEAPEAMTLGDDVIRAAEPLMRSQRERVAA